MARYDLVVKGGAVVTPALGPVRADIGLSGGKIAALAVDLNPADGESVLDASGKVVLPGAVDSHFHIGIYRPHSEDAASESASAATGGVTTLISYFRTGHNYLDKAGPYREIFPEVLRASESSFLTDYAYHLAPMTPEHVEEADFLLREHGVSSFKFYMFYGGLDLAGSLNAREYIMTDNPYDLGHLYSIMRKVAALNQEYASSGGARLNVHCENPNIIRVAMEEVQARNLSDLEAHSLARPTISERLAIYEAATLADATDCPISILHISSGDALQAGLEVQAMYPGVDIKLETTLHHLGLTTMTGGGVLGKVNPPLRGEEDVETLWEAAANGSLDRVVSDHACNPTALKGGQMWTANPGFGGASLIYPLMLSEGYHKRGVSLARIAELVALNPARSHGLFPTKGTITIGADADLAIVDLELERVVGAEGMNSAQDYTPFAGMRLKGWPTDTLVRGTPVLRDGRIVAQPGVGRYIKRPVALHGS